MNWGLPSEPLPLASVFLGVCAILFQRRAATLLGRVRARSFVLACALASALLSALWVAVYLRGGPRIIDATAYYLEGRALAEGRLRWPLGEPEASFAGRFLVRDAASTEGARHLAGIFPPGYPLALAIGFWVGAPMAIGPVLAALVTTATAALAREAALASDCDAPLAEKGAALLATLSAALRYHTADTMSHGLAALLVATALAGALALRRRSADSTPPRLRTNAALYVLVGAASGWLVATRPVSGAALVVAVVGVLGWRSVLRPLALLAPLGAAPFMALLLLHQHAATGTWLASSQTLYYAVSDGPAGCFRYGFGAGIGCKLEHGDFVAHNLEHGYGLVAALKTTARRLSMHGVDALNAEPLTIALTLPALVFAARRRPLLRLAATVAAFVLAYAPFYFDGNYPAGGARFYADVLPVELSLTSLFVTSWLARRVDRDPGRLIVVVGALSLLGFSLRAHRDHEQLRDREGGRPMFEPSILSTAPTARGLVFIDTDHGFLLGFDPAHRADQSLEVVRYRGDDVDYFLWLARGTPESYRYVHDFSGGPPRLQAYEPRSRGVVEAESLWPPVGQRGAYALRSYPSCAAGAALRLELPRNELDTGEAHEIALSLPSAVAHRSVTPQLVFDDEAGVVELELRSADTSVITVEARAEVLGSGCVRGPLLTVGEGPVEFVLHPKTTGVALDAITYTP
ncbi:MAG: hypothetical protein U0271_03415 [Polyangiaceae bacterium]